MWLKKDPINIRSNTGITGRRWIRISLQKKKTSIFRVFQANNWGGGGGANAKRGRSPRYALPRRACIALYAHFSLAFTRLKKAKKKLPTYPSLTGTAVEERLNCLTILYFHFPHLTSSSAILIFSMCMRRWFNILPRIWSLIIPESRSPISSCHFTSKEGQDPWCIPRGGTRRKIG